MLLQPKKLKPGRKALNDVLAHVVNALKAPNRRDGLKFGIFIVRTTTLSPELFVSVKQWLMCCCNTPLGQAVAVPSVYQAALVRSGESKDRL